MLLDRRTATALPRFKPTTNSNNNSKSSSSNSHNQQSLSTIKNWLDPTSSTEINTNTHSRPQAPLPHNHHHAPAGPGPSSSSSSKNSLIKPLGNSFRRKTPLFSRRLSSSSMLQQKSSTSDTNKQQQPLLMEKKNSNNRHSSLVTQTTPTQATYIRPTTSPICSPPHQLATLIPNYQHTKPKQRLPVLNRASLINYNNNNNKKSPEAPVTEPISVLSHGKTSYIPQSPGLYRPGPRTSSLKVGLKRLSGAAPVNRNNNSSHNVPSTPHFHYPAGLNIHTIPSRRGSTLTLASTCTADSDQEYKSSDLASIQLPSSPTNSLHPSIASVDLLSDFPMPPSRTPHRSPSSLMPHPPSSFRPIDTTQDLYCPFKPPQIPLPPLPCSSISSRFHFTHPSPRDQLQLSSNPNSPSLSYLDNTPTQPTASTEPLPTPLPLINAFHTPDLASPSGDHLDDFLDLYDHSPVAPQRFMRLNRPHSMPLSSARTGLTNTNLLEVNLPTSRPSHHPDDHDDDDDDDLTPEQEEEEDDHLSLVVSDELVQFGKMTDDEEASDVSEIDLNEPLDMMAVRLGYQLDLPDASDSDDDDRSYHFDHDEDELLDNRSPLPPPSRGPSRLLQFRSLSSLRAHFPGSGRSRAQRVVLAEVSSSDEEEFDLKLDHAHLSSKQQQQQQQRPAEEHQENHHKETIKRSSYGSASTQCSYTATTPSSSSSSYGTNLPTPESGAMSEGCRIGENTEEMIRGVVGLGFEMGEARHQGTAGERHHEYLLPGTPGSVERRQWLLRAFSKHDDVSATPLPLPLSAASGSPALLSPATIDDKELEERVAADDEEGRSQRGPGAQGPDVTGGQRGGWVSPTVLSSFGMAGGEDESEKEECLAVEEGQEGDVERGQSRQSVAGGRGLKPLMLGTRPGRHLSYPLIATGWGGGEVSSAVPGPRSSIQYTHSAPRPGSLAAASSASAVATAALDRPVRARTSLLNLAYHRSLPSPAESLPRPRHPSPFLPPPL